MYTEVEENVNNCTCSTSSSSEDVTDASTVRRLSPASRQNFRKNVNIVVCLAAAASLLIFHFVGAVVFFLLESRRLLENSEDVTPSECLSSLSVGAPLTAENLKNLKLCLKIEEKPAKIDNLGKSLYFSWTLYTTVGYGNLYPQTNWGKFWTAIFSLAMIPLYIAFKFEFGSILAQYLLKLSIKLGDLMKRIVTPTTSPENSSRDDWIFCLSVAFCIVSLLISSLVFGFSEDVNFGNSVYFGVVTMSLIGLGDYFPQNLPWFLVYSAFFLISDVLSNQIFYFCQAKIRRYLHFLARRALLLKNDDESVAENTISLNHVPIINSQCMPSHVLTCEKEELNRDEKLTTCINDGFE